MGNKFFYFTAVIIAVALCGCSSETNKLPDESYTVAQSSEMPEEKMFTSISTDDAKSIIDENPDCIILDVRTDEEYNEGHIPNAILIPNYEIDKRAGEELPDKDALILVYCRTGRRSKAAASALSKMGYTNVKEFGGIESWHYETVTESQEDLP